MANVGRVACQGGLAKDERAWLPFVRLQLGELPRVKRPLRHREVARGGDEGRELCVGDLVALDRKGPHSGFAQRSLLAVEAVRTHHESAAWQGHHARWWR